MIEKIYTDILAKMKVAPLVPASKWQSIDISDKPHMATREILNYSLTHFVNTENLDWHRQEIRPNLPWADVHFETERVSGMPINPGESWKLWPGASNAATMIKDGQYDHSYAERYWPKWAGHTDDGHIGREDDVGSAHFGVRYEYGDLNTLVRFLSANPLTRQAYLPIWFPEDLEAARSDARVPCTLGYHFIMREGRLHVVYYMRSCDLIRHWRDDVYLTIRLLLWVLGQCRIFDPHWRTVKPGTLTMHITSLHMFQADHKRIFR